jgi:hypothetical protein
VLHYAPGVHHRDLVGGLGDHAEVVGDHDHRRARLTLQAFDQLEDLRLHRHVEGGGGLVGDQQAGLVDQRHRDHRALTHPARELVGIGLEAPARLGDADEPEQPLRTILCGSLGHVVVGADRLHELSADPVEGMQRGERVLEDHRDLPAAHVAQLLVGHRQQVAALEEHLPAEVGVARAGEP